MVKYQETISSINFKYFFKFWLELQIMIIDIYVEFIDGLKFFLIINLMK